MKYRIEKEIHELLREIGAIGELKETIQTRGWKHIVTVFQEEISELVQSIYDRAKEPEKNLLELRCRWMLSEALGKILSTMDNRVSKEDYVKQQYAEKVAALAEMQARQIEPL